MKRTEKFNIKSKELKEFEIENYLVVSFNVLFALRISKSKKIASLN